MPRTDTLPGVPPRVAANPALAGVARTLLLDAAAAECISALRAEGIRAILLKGPVTARWLYSGHPPRTYIDVDLLVAPDEVPQALRTLEGLGYRDATKARSTIENLLLLLVVTLKRTGEPNKIDWPSPAEVQKLVDEGTHAVPLERSPVPGTSRFPAGISVDLHWSFHGIGAPAEHFWTAVAAEADQMQISGTEVDVPSEPARALLLALHAGTLRPSVEQPLRDLDRALERLPGETWRAARSLAVRLDAVPRFATGLGMRPLGLRLIARLHLQGAVDVSSVLHVMGDRPPIADSIARLTNTRGLAPRVRLLARGLIPTVASMRFHWRLARRGSLGLALAYLYRPAWLLAKLPAALRAYARARRVRQADDQRDSVITGAGP
jgi:Uncharacterised nucleotidyltransferase